MPKKKDKEVRKALLLKELKEFEETVDDQIAKMKATEEKIKRELEK